MHRGSLTKGSVLSSATVFLRPFSAEAFWLSAQPERVPHRRYGPCECRSKIWALASDGGHFCLAFVGFPFVRLGGVDDVPPDSICVTGAIIRMRRLSRRRFSDVDLAKTEFQGCVAQIQLGFILQIQLGSSAATVSKGGAWWRVLSLPDLSTATIYLWQSARSPRGLASLPVGDRLLT